MSDEEVEVVVDPDQDHGFDEPEPHLDGDDSLLAERYAEKDGSS
jgi:hypothetical protein